MFRSYYLLFTIMSLPACLANSCYTCSSSDSNDLCNQQGTGFCDFDAGHVCQTKYEWRWNDLNVEKICQTAIGACDLNKQLGANSCSNPTPGETYSKCYYCCNTPDCNEDPESEGQGGDPEPACRIGEILVNDEYCVVLNHGTFTFTTGQNWCTANYDMKVFTPFGMVEDTAVAAMLDQQGIPKTYLGWYYTVTPESLVDYNTGNEVFLDLTSIPWLPREPSRSGCISYLVTEEGWDAIACGVWQSIMCSAPKRTVDGLWTEWTSWSTCSKTCGGGELTRTRSCTNPKPVFGGIDCPGLDVETQACNIEECVLDGNWAAWSEWTTCTASCAGGTKTKSRSCTDPPPTNGGEPCVGDSTSTVTCNTQDCPIDGGWTSWTAWSSCTQTCGSGSQSRSRSCTNPTPAFGGEVCAGSGHETRTCNTEFCPVDGQWSDWGPWSTCTASCDEGSQVRYRACDSPAPSNGGATCLGLDTESQACTITNCPVNGAWSDWTDWSTCSQSCDPGTQTRSRTCDSPTPLYGGADCVGATSESQDCIIVQCPVDGSWSAWGTWSECTATCAPGGTQIRYKECNNPAPAYGGLNCAGDNFVSQTCNQQSCPVDGGWTEWSNWSSCSLSCGTGMTSRVRSCSNPYPSNGGVDCSGDSTQEITCVENPSCPVDGGWSTWTAWSSCSNSCGGGGTATRTRSCTNPSPQNGGSNCLGVDSEVQTCNQNVVCPIHGGWSDWGTWSSCSLTCGTGVMTRSRTCSNPYPADGGDDCQGDNFQTGACDGALCAVDGGFSAWTDWTTCSVTCGGGTSSRSRTCTNPIPQNGGLDCIGVGEETLLCGTSLCPVNGSWSDWNDWSSCSVSCTQGSRIRTRFCNNPSPANGGLDCEGSSFATELCTEQANCPIHGNFSSWSSWGSCSTTCDDGVSLRSRSCDNPPPQYGGDDCSSIGHYNETSVCNLGYCEVDGEWGQWLAWSTCTVTCGSGTKVRQRLCDNPAPAHGGISCAGINQETSLCNTFGCPVDGGWSAWSAFSTCTATCGGGTQLRLRNCNNPEPSNGGVSCVGDSLQTQTCNENVCPDLNNAPSFNETLYEINIQEQLSPGVYVTTLQATDTDVGSNGVVIYSIFDGDNADDFYLDQNTGLMTTQVVLDREVVEEYFFTIYAIDQASSPKTGTTLIRVVVDDVNDHDPIINHESYIGAVQEVAEVGTRVMYIRASDEDTGENGRLTYSITSGNEDGMFQIDSVRGEVTLKSQVDREAKATYSLVIRVTDNGSPAKFATTEATVKVVDNNDNAPVFENSNYEFEVEEGAAAGMAVGLVQAIDADIGDNGEVSYLMGTIIQGDSHFTVNGSGSVILLLPPDRESVDIYSFTVRAFDNGPVPQVSITNVTVRITDMNDNDPQFTQLKYTANLVENAAADSEIILVSALDDDTGNNGNILYTIIPPNSPATQYVKVSSTTGKVTVKNGIDREQVTQLEFTVKALDGGVPQRSASASVLLTVADVNDNNPVFNPNFYSCEVPYNDETGFSIATLRAADADIGVNKQISYSWTNVTDHFKLNGATGVISIINGTKILPGEKYVFTAKATDGGRPARQSSVQATIRVDVFDPASYLIFYEVELPKSAVDAQISSFLSQLTRDLRSTYPTIQLYVYKTQDTSGENKRRKKRATSTTIWLYGVSSNKTNSVTELSTPKDFIPKDDLSFVAQDSTVNNDWPVLEVGSYANKQVIEPTKAPQVGFASTSGGIALIIIMALLMLAVAAVVVVLVLRGKRQRIRRKVRGGHHHPPGVPQDRTAWANEIGPRKLAIVEDAITKMNPHYTRHPPPNMTGWEKVMYNQANLLGMQNQVNPVNALELREQQLALPAPESEEPQPGQLALPWHDSADQMSIKEENDEDLIERELAQLESKKPITRADTRQSLNHPHATTDGFDEVDVSTTVNDGAPINAPIIEEPDDDDEVPTIPMPSDHEW